MTPKKKATKKADASKDASQPMDPTAREEAVATPATNAKRVCHAAKTLVAEVDALFPETTVEVSNFNGRNTALDVSFDLTSLDSEDASLLTRLISLTEDDNRVASVLVEDGQVLVAFHNNPRTHDSRESFDLLSAHTVLTARDEDFGPDEEDFPEGSAGETRTIHRSAVDGRLVTAEYAAENPDTTVAETVES